MSQPEQNHSYNNLVFHNNHAHDPFRVEKEAEKEVEKVHYTLNFPAKTEEEKPVISEQTPHSETEKSSENLSEKRSVKDVFKDALHQIFASAVFLVIGFVLLNWGALSQIVVHEWNKLNGVYENSPLQQLVENKNTDPIASDLETDNAQIINNGDIPALNLDIAPSDNRIIIPDINQNVPIVSVSSESLLKRDWKALEREMQTALQDGVVHYPGTSVPGQKGNIVVTGHSSYFPWDPGRFKDVFALLHSVKIKDQIVVYYNQKKYVYVVSNIRVVLPEDIEVLKQTPNDQLTLITCTPVGTNLKRLIVTAVPLKDYQEL